MNRKIYKTIICLAALSVIAAAGVVTAHASYSYKDVPANHWAYNAISEISEKGLMVGDSLGHFRPSEFIDKFNTSKILAMAAGYKYTNATDEEKIYFDRAYEKNRSLLTQYQKTYSRWNSSADREIAFLLEKEILTVDDLNQFIVRDSKNEQQLRALSRQEAAVFLVKLMGRKTDALAGVYDNNFTDHADVYEAYKPYVYYLRNIGVITGDTSGNFIPNNAVTRASMAVMLNRVVGLMEGTAAYSSSANSQQQSDSTKVETVSGTIDKIYAEFNGIQILSGESRRIYRLAVNASIYIDSYLKTAFDLNEGMSVSGVLSSNELVSVQAQSVASSSTLVPGSNTPMSTITGVVDSISTQETGQVIGIKVLIESPAKEIIPEVKSYVLAEGCAIARGNENPSFGEIISGEVVTAQISGSKCFSLKLEPKFRRISGGTLIEKKMIASTETPLLIVTDENGDKSELRVTDATTVIRNSEIIDYKGVRLGDTVDVTCDHDVIKELYATGIHSAVEGYVEEIYISSEYQYIVLRKYDGERINCKLIIETVDVYSLRIGMTVSLTLDSMEVTSIRVLKEAP